MPKPPLSDQLLEKVSSANLYTLSINRSREKTIIIMRLLIPEINTKNFPQTSSILKIYLPSIFKSTCYNSDNLPFSKEVLQTEVGHLFEHILLEYLCILKLEQGVDHAVYEGMTNWNWLRDPRGTFHITIHGSMEDLNVFNEALRRTMKLTNLILSRQDSLISSLPLPAGTTKH